MKNINHRQKLEIIRDILELLNKSKDLKHTNIISKANLSSKSCTKYLNYLIKRGYVEKYSSLYLSNMYKITDKGLDLLEKIKKYNELFKEFKDL